jgi:hypothetical protein
MVRPVILPPGRARLAMNPKPTGSPTATMTRVWSMLRAGLQSLSAWTV